MEHNTVYKFDIQNCPLDGINIIEASAGTGKTYTIQSLYAKLILLKGYCIDSILVVTFTDAATKELKTRIRNILNELYLYFEGKPATDEIRRLADADFYYNANGKKVIVNHELRRKRVYNAINNFEDAAIFTIHGFCNNVLNDYSFETGILFNVQLEKNIEPVIRDITEDFWRLETYSAPLFKIAALNYNSISIDSLSSYVKNFTNKGEIYVYPEKKIDNDKINVLKNIFHKLQSSWNMEEVKAILERPEISRAKFKINKIDEHIQNIELFLDLVFNKEIIKTVSKFTSEYIESAVKKSDRQAFQPSHPFFANCSDFINNIDSLNDFGIHIKSKFRNYFYKEYDKRKYELNIQSFNDLLSKVDEHTDGNNSQLLHKLTSKYNAAFIDEFQDTDSVQYSIFKKIFINPSKTIFMVGDPKQAIYGFRGGDIFTYRKAKEQISQKGKIFTLPKNWRSSPDMVNAVNSLFTKGNCKDKPFVTDSINYIEVLSDKKNNNLHTKSSNINKSLKFIYISEPQNSTGLSVQCAEQTAALTYKILAKHNSYITENTGVKRSLKPSDIAILVTKHYQAQLIQPELAKYKIPAVLQATGSVFETLEAEDFVYLLKAIAEPSNTQTLKGALLTNILSYSVEELAMLTEMSDENSNSNLEEFYLKFRKCHNTWLKNSFLEMFNCLCIEFNLKDRILAKGNGERILTNVLHIAEILQNQETELKLGINGLIHWLSKQLHSDTRERKDEYEIKLETDENAVKIMTVFKSKGLEFPIVLCPYLWDENAISSRRRQPKISKYHLTPDIIDKTGLKKELLYKPILDITGKEEPESYSNDEKLEELMRFTYVALTRSKYQCYVIWGNTSSKNSSALDYLFYSNNEVLNTDKGNIASRLSTLAKNSKKNGILPGITANQNQFIEFEIYESNQKFEIKKYLPETIEYKNKLKPKIAPKLKDYYWKISSFSSIAPHPSLQIEKISQKDYDETDISSFDNIENNLLSDTRLNIFNFPAGAKTGTCWHEIFEELDFSSSDSDIQDLIKEKLIKYRLVEKDSERAKEESIKCVLEMAKKVLNKNINVDNSDSLKLKNISQENKLPEMEFLFSLKEGFNTDELYSFIRDYTVDNGFSVNNSDMLSGNKLICGYMTGFIDLIFRHDNKYYIVDWKSNRLDGLPENFTNEGLKEEISKHFYFLQYLIYTVALDKYLQTHIKNYDYSKHFGGVFYIFLRGVETSVNSDRGFYYDKPEEKDIRKLAEILK